ncbi:MAG: zf-HC2 domain-containing protein [Pyrinomonadaceae bacterium]|nr:zf-HC2 domain-containing protein [Pyrinomonadaceae bacterium]
MLDSRKNNPNCGLSEEISSYLYDELEGTEKQEFEQHLRSCSACENEIAAFSVVSSSIKDWRDTEFAPLKTPAIEILYETDKNPILVNDSSESSPSWIENLRGFFASTGMKTVAGFASLLVIFGLGWFLIGSLLSVGDVAQTPEEKVTKPVGGDERVDPESEILANENDAPVDKPTELTEETQELAVDKTSQPRARRSGTTKAAYESRLSAKKRKPVRRNVKRKRFPSKKPKENKTKDENPVIQVPIDRLTEEFAIDKKKEDELRLSDLFDEVGSDK